MIRSLSSAIVCALCVGSVSPFAAGAQAPDAARRRRPEWNFSLTALTQAESNARFVTGSDLDDWYRQVTGSMSGGIANARSQLEVQLSGDLTKYETFTELDRVTYTGSVHGSTKVSPSWTFEARSALGRVTSTGFGQTAADLGALPLVVANTFGGHVQADWRKSGRTSAIFGTGITQLRFDAAGFPDGRTFDAGAEVRRKMEGASTFGARGIVTQAELGEQRFVSTVTSANWNWARRNWSLRLGGGAVMLTGDSIAKPQLGPTAEGEIRRTGLRSAVTATLSHGTIPALGVGEPLVTNQAALALERRGILGTTVRLTGDYFRGASLRDDSEPFSAQSFNAEIRRTLFGGVYLQFGGFVRTRVFGEEVANRGVYLSGGYAKTVRR